MSSDLQCLYSTSIDIPETLRESQQSSDILSRAFIYIAQEAAERLQQFPVSSNNHPVKTITIRAINPEFNLAITVEPLTDREIEVLQLIVEGYSNSAISKKLYITVGTTKTHVRNILKKLCVNDRPQAAIWALRAGLVQ